jgi:hypothetical protein
VAAGDAAVASARAAERDALAGGVAPARERAERLAGEARAELDALPAERQREPIVLRARAMALVAGSDRAGAARISREARALVADPWLALAGILAELPDAGAEEHQRAVDRLDKLAAGHPELIRARVLGARIRAGMGESETALGALDGVLRMNPEHLEARRLRDEVAAAAAAPAGEPAPAAAQATPPGNGGSQRGNTVTQGDAR